MIKKRWEKLCIFVQAVTSGIKVVISQAKPQRYLEYFFQFISTFRMCLDPDCQTAMNAKFSYDSLKIAIRGVHT